MATYGKANLVSIHRINKENALCKYKQKSSTVC